MNKPEAYRWAKKRIRAQDIRHMDVVATLANTSAILKEYLPNFFWVGFYFVHQDYLLLDADSVTLDDLDALDATYFENIVALMTDIWER